MKNSFAGWLPEGSFARGVGLLLGGTAGAQLLTVIAAPLLTRLYSPDDFGILAVYAGLLGLIGALSSLYYFLAIPLPEDDGEAANLVALCLSILAAVTLATAIAALLLAEPVATMLGIPEFAQYFWLVPVGVLLSGAYSVFSHWSIRIRAFADIAVTGLGQTLATLAIQIAGFKFGAGALVVGHAAGQGVGSVRLAARAFRNRAFDSVSRTGIADAAKRHRRFPLYLSWAGLFNTAGNQLPPLMFAALFSAGAAGLFALAYRILALPIHLVGNAVGNVFLSDAPAAHREGRLGELVGNVHDKLAQIAMPPALLVFLAGPDLFVLVFGADWQGAGSMARWMAPWIYVMLCDSGLRVFVVTGHQRLSMVMHAAQLVVRVAAIAAGAFYGDLMLAVVLYSFGSAVTYAVFIHLKLRVSQADPGAAFRSHVKALLVALVCVVPVLVAIFESSETIALIAGLTATVLLTAGRYMLLQRYNY